MKLPPKHKSEASQSRVRIFDFSRVVVMVIAEVEIGVDLKRLRTPQFRAAEERACG